MENMIEVRSSNPRDDDDEIYKKNELLDKLWHERKENEKLISMVKIMRRNYENLHTLIMKHKEECLRSCPRSMPKNLKLGLDINAGEDGRGGFPKQSTMDQISLDCRSSESESLEEKTSKVSMEIRQSPPLPCKKRKINHVLEHEKEDSFMDPTGLSNEKAFQDYRTMAATKKIITVRRRSETDTVSDGCQWRKYGAKMTRNSPWPRGYFKCAMSPSCPVKKQVQRCARDSAVIITTYEGEHNHFLNPMARAAMNGRSEQFSNANLIPNNRLPFPASIATISSMGSSPTITLDLTENPDPNLNSIPTRGLENVQPQFPAGMFMHPSGFAQNDPLASLKADPNFTAALAVAIAGSMFNMGAPAQGNSTATKAQASPSVTHYSSTCPSSVNYSDD